MAQWRVLIADDNPEISAVVQAALRQDGRFDLYQATDGEEALNMARLHLPHLVLLDVMMPSVHGLKVCKTLKSDPHTSRIKIIMLSALARGFTKREAYRNGADAYITKPFILADLISNIESVIRGLRGPGGVGRAPVGDDASVFNRGDEVRVRISEDEPEASGIIMNRIPPGQWQENEWGYRIALDSGVKALVKWDQVALVSSFEHVR